MTIQYNTPVKWLFMFRGMTNALLGVQDTSSVNRGITVYSGAQPSADAIQSSWASYNSSYLIHFQNIPLSNPSIEAVGGASITNGALPSAVTAINTGTAAWAIVWAANPGSGTGAGEIGNATIPTTSFIVVPVTASTSNGVVRFASTSIVSGNSYMISDFTLVGGVA